MFTKGFSIRKIIVRLRWFACGALMMLANKGFAQDYMQAQNRIKSIYLYNFMKDIQWPVLSETEVKICMLKDGFNKELGELIQTKNINSKTVKVIAVSSFSECRQCDLIFIEEKNDITKFKRTDRCGGLIVTHGFFEPSLTNVALIFQNNKLQFSINTDLCEKLGFKVSQHLFSLANQKMIMP
jgi:hypothetical protein